MNEIKLVNSDIPSSILIDDRWIGNHGIGRFAHEVVRRLGPYCSIGRDIPFLGVWEPFQLSIKLFQSDACVYFSPGYNPPLWSKIPVVFTIHDLIHLNVPDEGGVLKWIYYKWLVRPSIHRAFRILTVSQFSKKEIVRWSGVSPDKVVVVGNGVDEAFSINGERHQPGFPYFFYIGSHKPHKNLERIIRSFLMSTIPEDVKLIIAGNLDDNIRKMVLEQGGGERVNFSGIIPEEKLPSYYRGAIALLLPSLYEGFGLPIIESMACGTPVITSNVTAMPEVAGDAALLVNPYDTGAIAAAIEKIYREETVRNALREKGIHRARAFSWEKTAKQVAYVLEMAVKEREKDSND